MARFDIYFEETVIGSSELESGDPPMGVAFGRFVPNSEYKHFHGSVVSKSQVAHALSVRSATGEVLEVSGGVHIEDHSSELGPEGIEVSVLGIARPAYEALFPEHVAAYERQFKDS